MRTARISFAALALGLTAAAPLEAQATGRPEAYLGLKFECSKCEILNWNSGAPATFRFSSPPVLFAVDEDSPAEHAGLQAGDTIMRVDGIDIVSEEGGRRFAALAPGIPVVLTVRRSGVSRDVTLEPTRAGDRTPGQELERAAAVLSRVKAALASIEADLRYSGSFNGVTVQVTGPDPINVTRIGTDCRLIIVVGETRILMNPEKACSR